MQAHFSRAWILVVLLILGACATTKNPYYDTPPSQLLKDDQRKFLQALEAQQKGQIQVAVDLWQKFVREHPRSYEAHNNLGMTLYANDQLGLALEELHKAHELEPSDVKIKENLARTLKFQTALLVENKEYERAIENWGLISELSPDEKEKISYKIEELEDRIFEQVKRSNTLEDYKSFVERYPESSNAESARKRMEELGRARVVTPDPKSAETSMAPEADKHTAMTTPSSAPASTPAPAPTPTPTPAPTPPPAPAETAKEKKVKVTTKSLRVRASPSTKAKTIARLKSGAEVKLLSEKGAWYKVEFSKGKSGWVSKKFTQPVE